MLIPGTTNPEPLRERGRLMPWSGWSVLCEEDSSARADIPPRRCHVRACRQCGGLYACPEDET